MIYHDYFKDVASFCVKKYFFITNEFFQNAFLALMEMEPMFSVLFTFTNLVLHKIIGSFTLYRSTLNKLSARD